MVEVMTKFRERSRKLSSLMNEVDVGAETHSQKEGDLVQVGVRVCFDFATCLRDSLSHWPSPVWNNSWNNRVQCYVPLHKFASTLEISKMHILSILAATFTEIC